jgi:hypothetical protein
MNLANEGFEARKKEEEVVAKKRKAEDDAKWEGNVVTFRTSPPVDSLFCAQRTANSVWTVGAALPVHRKRRKSKRQMSLAEVLLHFSICAVSVLVHITSR